MLENRQSNLLKRNNKLQLLVALAAMFSLNYRSLSLSRGSCLDFANAFIAVTIHTSVIATAFGPQHLAHTPPSYSPQESQP